MVVVTVPTVNFPIIEAGCASHTYVYVPSANVTVQVVMPVVSTPVASLTPGPNRSKLWMSAWSLTLIVYVPGSRCVTRVPFWVRLIE